MTHACAKGAKPGAKVSGELSWAADESISLIRVGENMPFQERQLEACRDLQSLLSEVDAASLQSVSYHAMVIV